MSRKPTRLVDPPVAVRQAAIRKAFGDKSPPQARGGRKPKTCALMHVRFADPAVREAVMNAARDADTTVNAWLVAATRLALHQQAKLPLPQKPEKRNVIAEALREQRERHELKDREERLRLVRALREEGLSESTIARLLGLSPSAFCHFLKKYGTQRGRAHDERFDKALELIDAGLQMSEVARRLGTSVAAIKYHLGKRG
jgi:predicted transcriptional regulator